jgi:hypothetical protein
MSPRAAFAALFLAGSLLFGAAAVKAEPQSETERSAPTKAAQVAVLPAPQLRPQAPLVPLLKTNELRADPRWPLFKGCIEKTATPDAFRACLENVFADEMAVEQPRP